MREFLSEYFCYACRCRVLVLANPQTPQGKPACHCCGDRAYVRETYAGE